MACRRVAFHENDGNHEKDENDEDNSDKLQTRSWALDWRTSPENGTLDQSSLDGAPPQILAQIAPKPVSNLGPGGLWTRNRCAPQKRRIRDANHGFPNLVGISANDRPYRNKSDESHGNPGCKPRVPQTTGLETPDNSEAIMDAKNYIIFSILSAPKLLLN